MPAGRGQKSAVALAVATAAALLLHARAWRFVCDDAYISFRYAWNLAQHGALEYNLGERVEGYTNFLWVVVLALGTCLGALPEALAPWLTQLGALAGAAATVVLVRALRGASGWTPADLIPAMLLAAAPEYVVWAHGGLETSWAAASTIAAMAATASGRWRAAGLATALAGLTRPDAVLPIGVFVATWSIGHVLGGRRDRLPSLREAAMAAALAGGPLLGHLLWRWTYYGEWLPNTWAIKQHGRLLRDTFGVAYVTAWASALRLVWLAPLALLLRARHAALALPIAAVLAYAWSVGGDFMAYGRFLMVATALTAGAVGWLLVEAGERLLGPRGPATATGVGIALAAVLGVMSRERLLKDRATPTGWLDGRWEGVTAMDRFARERVAAGTWFKEHVPEDIVISVGAAGALPYASRLRAVDVYGLVDRWPREVEVRPQVKARPGHQLMAPQAVILARDPDLFCHVGHVGPKRPSPAAAQGRGFGRDMVWACAEPGAVADPREPGGVLEVGYYCCLRRRGRPVGPFVDEVAP
ncbi:hypothetical protein SAMN02745121_06589 [Nannocystis exedens]|uniref:Dolichyl-phosphate-mannose-protein mannosyltransferase n=1 Tax=Nannocystis exedens TaxID=54 RepID=A0A1I2FDS7_9BACT|nr:hypothetical protein [Nannocystis exedens]PCC70492.1 hypothetical protein NAEX_03555 [Nannocystis exedens]SFF03395.1 hypothetical protein SAMN02745121_06589 [Nannocystis exedens]